MHLLINKYYYSYWVVYHMTFYNINFASSLSQIVWYFRGLTYIFSSFILVETHDFDLITKDLKHFL